MKSYQIHDEEYLNLVKTVLIEGEQKTNRTGTGTISTFAKQMRFDLTNMSIPLLTTKKMHTKSIIHEILWYLQGGTNVKYLQENGVRIWNEWADDAGNLGPVYGKQWREWARFKPVGKMEGGQGFCHTETIDQIGEVIWKLKNTPDDRRIIVSAWNVGELQDMALPPCHAFFQFWANDGKLKCHLYQRSCDVGLGVPFNIAQYSILTHMIAQVVGMEAVEFVWTGGDVHIYTDHLDALHEQVLRMPMLSPQLKFTRDVNDIDDFKFEDFEIVGYKSHETLKMKVSV